MDPDQPTDDLQCRVLQSTLDEISTRHQQDSADCCVICLESISEACEALPCQHHNFDYLCLINWLEHSPKCPLCKATVVQVRHALDQPVAKVYDVPQPAPPPPQDSRTYSSTSRTQYRRPFRRRAYRDTPHDDTRTETISSAISQRRDIYRRNCYSKHVGSNRVSRYRELTPALFCSDVELVSRARMWIRRELQVFSFLSLNDSDSPNTQSTDAHGRSSVAQRRANNAEFLLEYIIAVLKSVDIMGSGGQAEDMVSDFLGRENTRLFLHELRAWLRSPYTKLEDWDRAVQYDDPASTTSVRPEVPRPATTSTESGERGHPDPRTRDHPMTRGDYYRPSRSRIQKQRPSSRYDPSRRRGGRPAHKRHDDRIKRDGHL